MMHVIESYANIGDVRIDGIEIMAVRYKTIVDNMKKKNYDILDYRRSDVSTSAEIIIIIRILNR
jgi:dynein heavy chain